MILDRFPEIQALSPEEKLLLSSELQDDALDIKEDAARHKAILELLEQRDQKYQASPASALTLDELRTRHEENKRAWRESRK